MTDQVLIALEQRVDHLTIVLADLLEACRLYETAIIRAQHHTGDVDTDLRAARKKREEACERLDKSTEGKLMYRRQG